MARPLRIEYEGAFYHVTSRGNDRKRIYFTDSDYYKFRSYLKEAQQKYGYVLHCYVLMPNHYHLLLETPHANVSKVMHYMNGSYTNYINKKHRRSGHLFQGRYKAIVVDRDNYLLELSRYLHLNPVRARLVTNPIDYVHSSYKSYVSKSKENFVSCNLILQMISKDRKKAEQWYADFVEQAIQEEPQSPLKHVYGGMILGGRQFIKGVLGKLEEDILSREEISYRRELKGVWRSDEVIDIIASHLRVSRQEVFRNKGGHRKIAIYLIKEYTWMTNREIGELFGNMSYSAVSKTHQRLKVELTKNKSLQKRLGELTRVMSNVKG